MLCARCGTKEGIKEFDNELLCSYCYNIKQAAKNIALIAWKNNYCYSDRFRIEKLIEDIYNKGFNDGYWQSIKDDYSI